MEPAVQELLDKQALYELVVRYCRAVDRCDEELLRSVYHPDALDEHGVYTGGPDGFVEHLRRGSWSAAKVGARVQHIVANALFEIRGTTAFGESYCVVVESNAGRLAVTGVARLVDRYERRDGVWRIAHRRVIPDWLPPGAPAERFVEGFRDQRDPSYAR